MCCDGACLAGFNVDVTLTHIEVLTSSIKAAITRSINDLTENDPNDGIPNYVLGKSMNDGERAIVMCILNAVKDDIYGGPSDHPIEVGQEALETEGVAILVSEADIPLDPQNPGEILGSTEQVTSGGPIANTTSEFPTNRVANAPQVVKVKVDREAIMKKAKEWGEDSGIDGDKLDRVYVQLFAETALHEIMHTSLGHPRGRDQPPCCASSTNPMNPASWSPATGPDILVETQDAYQDVFGDDTPTYKRAHGTDQSIVLSGCLLNIFNTHHEVFRSVQSAVNAKTHVVPSYQINWLSGQLP